VSGGEALRALRERAGLTIYRLAELADVDPSMVSRLERGVRHPSRGTVELVNAGGGWDRAEAALLLRAFGYATDDEMACAQRSLVERAG
jgi:transcriptional regulator with XRE-family HTH domain